VNCCNLQDESYPVNVSCPSGQVFDFLCPNKTKGYFNVTCPSLVTRPQCLLWTGFTYTVDPLCTVISFNEVNTTCSCQVMNVVKSR
jgi:hypothetical protein